MPLHAFRIIPLVTVFICGGLSIIFVLVIVYLFHGRPSKIQNIQGEGDIKSKASDSENMTDCKNICGKLDIAFDRVVMSQEVIQKMKKIDKSTTYFGLHIVTEKCLMENFARKYYHGYQPTKGYGYYELTNPDEELDPSWDVILTDEVHFTCILQSLLIHICMKNCTCFIQKNEPIFSALGSAVNNQKSKNWRSVYVQSKSVKTELAPGGNFLYCKYFM